MFEIACPNCKASFEYTNEEYIHLCPFCSAGFIIDMEHGSKEIISDHFIVPSEMQIEEVKNNFMGWLRSHYHKSVKLNDEFEILGCYGVMLPYWVISLDAQTVWSGHSAKMKSYPGQTPELSEKFVQEQGQFSRRYRWAVLARRSPKEHWGIERLHNPKEHIMVDWDGFPLDESLGIAGQGKKEIYLAKEKFRFEIAGSLPVTGVQIKEEQAIMRARDQITEYHRRISKTKSGTLYEHRTEVEIAGIQLVHIPFWFIRYSFSPKSLLRFFITSRERHVVFQGYTKVVLDAELPVSNSEKLYMNLVLSGVGSFISLLLGFLTYHLFFLLFLFFLCVGTFSIWRIYNTQETDIDVKKGSQNEEPASL